MTKNNFILFFLFLLPFYTIAQSLNQTDGNGQKQGKWAKFYINGVPKYEGQFKNDKAWGEFKHYYENGRIKAISNFSSDGIICHTKTFHENSFPMASGKYIKQKKDSLWLYYSDINGSLVSEEMYKKGKLHGLSKTYFPDELIIAESIEYIDGKKNGELRKYFPDGSIMTESIYENDNLNGKFTLYHPDGSIQLNGAYRNGRQIGNWEYYDEEGKAISADEFKESN